MTRFMIPTKDFVAALERAKQPLDRDYLEHLLNDFAFADDFVVGARCVQDKREEVE